MTFISTYMLKVIANCTKTRTSHKLTQSHHIGVLLHDYVHSQGIGNNLLTPTPCLRCKCLLCKDIV